MSERRVGEQETVDDFTNNFKSARFFNENARSLYRQKKKHLNSTT